MKNVMTKIQDVKNKIVMMQRRKSLKKLIKALNRYIRCRKQLSHGNVEWICDDQKYGLTINPVD